MNHYANVNNTFRKSWKQQKPIQQVAPPRVSTAPSADRGGGGAGGGAVEQCEPLTMLDWPLHRCGDEDNVRYL